MSSNTFSNTPPPGAKAAFCWALILTSGFWLLPFSRAFHALLLVLLPFACYKLFFVKGFFANEPAKRYWLFVNACFSVPIFFSAISPFALDHEGSAKPLELGLMQLLLCVTGFVVIDLIRREKIRDYLFLISLVVLLFWAADLLFQVVSGADIFGAPATLRPGIYFDRPAKFGFYLAALSPLVLFNPFVLRTKVPIQFAVFAFYFAAVLLSNTRAAWLVYAYCSAIWFWYLYQQGQIRLAHITLVAISGAALIAVLAMFDAHFAQRLETLGPMLDSITDVQGVIPVRSEIWTNLGALVSDNLWLGTGAGNFKLAFAAYANEILAAKKIQPYAHQLILDILAGTGFLGLAGWLALNVAVIKAWLQSANRVQALPFFLVPVLTWFPLNTHRDIYSSEMMQFTWIWLAMSFALLFDRQSDSKPVLQ